MVEVDGNVDGTDDGLTLLDGNGESAIWMGLW